MNQKKSGIICWQIHPIREEHWSKSIVLCLIISFVLFTSFFYLSAIYGLISLIVLLVSLHKYFFKTTYILDSESVSIQTLIITTKKRWSYFQRFFIASNYIGFSPELKSSRLDNFRGMIVKLPKDGQQTIKKFIEKQMEQV